MSDLPYISPPLTLAPSLSLSITSPRPPLSLPPSLSPSLPRSLIPLLPGVSPSFQLRAPSFPLFHSPFPPRVYALPSLSPVSFDLSITLRLTAVFSHLVLANSFDDCSCFYILIIDLVFVVTRGVAFMF